MLTTAQGRRVAADYQSHGRSLDHARVEERLADSRRLTALADTELLDGPADPRLDRWARRAGVELDAPVALISLVDADRAFYAASCGVTGWPAQLRGTPLSHAPCQQVVSASAPLIVSDARTHPALRDSAAVSELGVVAFAGVPLLGEADLHALDARGDHVAGQPVEEQRVLVSTDRGKTFQERTPPAAPVDVNLDPAQPERIAITTAEGLFVSGDGGASWRQRDVLTTQTHLAWSETGPLYGCARSAIRSARPRSATSRNWQNRARRREHDDRRDAEARGG